MNIALIGYGRMGKEIERLAPARGIQVVARFDIYNNKNGSGLTPESLKDAHVCVDFSVPSEVLTNLQRVAECGKNAVIGTTGWLDQLDLARQIVEKNNIGLVCSSNFSIGVNVFLKLIHEAAKMSDRFEDYDVAVEETHHKEKLDAPSGTALEIGKTLLRSFRRKKEILTRTPEGKIKPEQLQISSTRIGSAMGIHTVTFDSLADTITLQHTAKSRAGFAIGALLAAEWIQEKRGVYSMQDVIRDLFP